MVLYFFFVHKTSIRIPVFINEKQAEKSIPLSLFFPLEIKKQIPFAGTFFSAYFSLIT